jgi:tetratricopeptide (TPR) repeat protein
MTQPFKTQHPEIDDLFDRYRRAPQSTIFAPLADACRKAGMIDEALDICKKGLAANPRYASGYVVQGKCLYDAEKPEDAEAAFRRVLELDGSNLVALKFIGIILSERGDTGAARACFEHILALDPEDRDIRRRLNEVGDLRRSETPVSHNEPELGPAEPVRRGPTVEPNAGRVPAQDVDTIIVHPQPAESLDDEEFEGAPITLGDASESTDDEIATMTLADIYATQGYTDKALRIYREVSRRQPDNQDLLRKIAALESRAERRAAAEAEAPAAVVQAEPPVREEAPAPKPAAVAQTAAGNRIDETRSYEQFKRWLRSVSD